MNDIFKIIRRSDRLYASLVIGASVIASGVLTDVADMTDLIARVRKASGHAGGLAMLNVKSLTRGWTLSRPLMLYPERKSAFEGRTHVMRVRPLPEGPRFPWEL